MVVRDILPVLARSIKLRKKKVSGAASGSLDDEVTIITGQTAKTLEGSLKDSRILLAEVSAESSSWLDSSMKDANDNTLLGINKIYIQTIGELKGRSFLIEDAIKQK